VLAAVEFCTDSPGVVESLVLPGQPLDLLLGKDGVEELLDDELVVVGQGLVLLELPRGA
jgi:hypothetical protein